ncbi:hypothetical protein AWM68_20255 [Fictibacillus phosphorivorans]|uniref:Uncharacterized protein n=1 Tax=Fictibacillus phosphorivorans TaxID=1221500 RepID=A0A163RFS6_9BACL|nr:hypothetical protein [Fictibacillus phosphorivorans]KZE66775.1 hypothetical protein AWM68_20255 [Fictibacillus phosphorivorans]
MDEINAFMNGYELGPELQCNNCGVKFHGAHTCQMDVLIKTNKELEEKVERLQAEIEEHEKGNKLANKETESLINSFQLKVADYKKTASLYYEEMMQHKQKAERLEKGIKESLSFLGENSGTIENPKKLTIGELTILYDMLAQSLGNGG